MEKWGYLAAIVLSGVILRWVWGLVNSLWVKPRQLECCLRKQGYHGRSYRFLFGDLKEETQMREEAKSKPINFSNDILARVLPLQNQMVVTHGKRFFTWVGPKPREIIAEPEQIKTIFSNINEFEKADFHPQAALVVPGLVTYRGAKWAKHRKSLIRPSILKN